MKTVQARSMSSCSPLVLEKMCRPTSGPQKKEDSAVQQDVLLIPAAVGNDVAVNRMSTEKKDSASTQVVLEVSAAFGKDVPATVAYFCGDGDIAAGNKAANSQLLGATLCRLTVLVRRV